MVMASGEHQVPARQAEKARMPELLGVPAAWILLSLPGSTGTRSCGLLGFPTMA